MLFINTVEKKEWMHTIL
jgi:hypothetical protein